MFRDCWAKLLLATTLLQPLGIATATTAEELQSIEPSPMILAHYMPWYVAKPHNQVWGWHWTMNHFDPEKTEDGKREIASHFYPLIGPYDSGDPHVLEYHLLTMKVAGKGRSSSQATSLAIVISRSFNSCAVDPSMRSLH